MPVEVVELHGHIIDSLTLPKVLDAIIELGGQFTIELFEIGRTRGAPSTSRIRIQTPRQGPMDRILERLRSLGAHVVDEGDADLSAAPKHGEFPEDFYATTNLPTHIRLGGHWVEVEHTEMDKGIAVDRKAMRAWTKLLDRGSWQTLGIVTDTEPFLRELAAELCDRGKRS